MHTRKVCDENERKKNDNCVNIFVVEEGIYNAVSEEWRDRFQRTSGYCFYAEIHCLSEVIHIIGLYRIFHL